MISNIVNQLNIAAVTWPGPFFGQGQGHMITAVHLESPNLLRFEQDLDDIFCSAFDGACMSMQNAVDFRLYQGTTGHGGEQMRRKRIGQVWRKPRSSGSRVILARRGEVSLYVKYDVC